MKLTILGSGTSVPHKERSSSGFWLETDSGTILLDCSASAVHRMAQENLDWAHLDAIWISHFHLDHVGGIPAFLFGMKYAPETQNRKEILKIFGAKGLRNLIEKFDAVNDYNLLNQPFPLEIIEVEPLEKFQILENVEAVAIDTPHTPESLAIHLRGGGNTCVYTADTGFTKNIAAFAAKVDLLILECSFFQNKPVETHLDLSEAMYLIRSAQPKKTILTHFYPEWDAINFVDEVKKFSPPGTIIEARDGESFEV